jgi:hypothetical protein
VYGPLSNVVGDHASQFYNSYVFLKKIDQIYKRFGWHVVEFSGRKETVGFFLIKILRWWLKTKKKVLISYDLNIFLLLHPTDPHRDQ